MTTSLFVPVWVSTLRARLAAAGFQPVATDRYERRHERDPRYAVQVRTSIRGDVVQAVLVSAVHDGEHSLYESSVVAGFLSGATLLDRMIERAGEAYAACNSHRGGGARNETRGT